MSKTKKHDGEIMNPEIEKERLQDAEREAAKARKRLQRLREKEAKNLYERSHDRKQFWADNRAALKPEALQDLERRQAEFLPLCQQVQDIIDGLQMANAKVGPPDGLPYPDYLFEEVEEYVQSSGNCRAVHHINEQEFTRIHHRDEPDVRELLYQTDLEWYEFGIFSRFTHDTLYAFLQAVAEYIDKHKDDPDFDFDPDTTAKVLKMRRGHTPIAAPPYLSQVDNGEAFLQDVEKQYNFAEKQNQKDRLDTLRNLAKTPINRGFLGE
jgi:hypothetical protein